MNQITVKTVHCTNKVDEKTITQLLPEVKAAKAHLLNGDAAGNDFLGWVNLPEEIDGEMLNRLKADVARLKGKSQLMVVIGIGGSYLGARMVIDALSNSFGWPCSRSSPPSSATATPISYMPDIRLARTTIASCCNSLTTRTTA